MVGKAERGRPLGRPRSKWEHSVKTDLKGTGEVIWTGFIWLRIGTSGGFL
jgi:hypothetical protein